MLIGIVCLLAVRYLRSRILLYLVVVIPSVYVCARAIGQWNGQSLVDITYATLGDERAGSIAVRFANEGQLIRKALQKPIFGWGPNGANNIYDIHGRIAVIPDGLWVIILGTGGIVALLCFYAALLAPMIGLLAKVPRSRLADVEAAVPLVLALIAALFAIDCLANAMVNSVYFVSIGSVAGLLASRPAPVQQEIQTAYEPIITVEHSTIEMDELIEPETSTPD
jgi:O-antigen ligase